MADGPRLYLVTPPIADAVAFRPHFEAALKAVDIACVWLRIAARDEGEAKKALRVLVPLAQAQGAACLVDDPHIAAHVGADGVHVAEGDGPLQDALAAMKPACIVGAGHSATRDSAMTAGEAGADYLMFGDPDRADRPDELIERIAWWTEIFNVPCVACAGNLGDVEAFARAGADFIALCAAVWDDPRGPAAAVRDAESVLAGLREATS
jgi:thiamine-phosphate pyrophosphorylase